MVGGVCHTLSDRIHDGIFKIGWGVCKLMSDRVGGVCKLLSDRVGGICKITSDRLDGVCKICLTGWIVSAR